MRSANARIQGFQYVITLYLDFAYSAAYRHLLSGVARS